jgi:hypothetical protein
MRLARRPSKDWSPTALTCSDLLRPSPDRVIHLAGDVRPPRRPRRRAACAPHHVLPRRLHPRSRQRRRNAHTGIATPFWMTATCVV